MRLLNIKRRLFTRCAGCGGWSTRANPVNCRGGRRPEAPQKPWDSEVGLYHAQCLADVSRANRRLNAQHSAEPHWHLYRFVDHLATQLDKGEVDRRDVTGILRRVADASHAEFKKIIQKGEE